VFSSSRLGIAFLVIEVLLAGSRPWRSFLVDLRKLRIIRSKIRPLLGSLLWLGVLTTLSSAVLLTLRENPRLLLMFLSGTGISDASAHSVTQRENSFKETVAVFMEHPLIGRSLGGISSAIAENEGKTIHSF